MLVRSWWVGSALWCVLAACAGSNARAQVPAKLNVIAIGAHPDDCDIRAGGLAIKLVKLGHRVRFVSLTNGDAGHYEMTPQSLAKRRFAEAKEAGKRAGVDYVVLDAGGCRRFERLWRHQRLSRPSVNLTVQRLPLKWMQSRRLRFRNTADSPLVKSCSGCFLLRQSQCASEWINLSLVA